MKARFNRDQATALLVLTHEWGAVDVTYDYEDELVVLVYKYGKPTRTLINKHGQIREEA